MRGNKAKILMVLGSGLESIFNAADLSGPISVRTEFGSVSMNRVKGLNTYVVKRHGPGHSIPPHMINYRGNLSAAKKLGVSFVIATSAVGSLKSGIPVGSYVVLDQFIDFTKNRPSSLFFDNWENFAHTDMTNPYSSRVRQALISSLRKNKIHPFRASGTYVCTEGPRFETPAEIKMFKRLGGDVVGMTGVPEVVIANELGLEYGSLSLVTNMAAGLHRGKISPDEVVEEMKKHLEEAKLILENTVRELT